MLTIPVLYPQHTKIIPTTTALTIPWKATLLIDSEDETDTTNIGVEDAREDR